MVAVIVPGGVEARAAFKGFNEAKWQAARETLGAFPKLRVPFLGVPIIRTIVFWGPYWGSIVLGNYHSSDLLCA